MSKDITILFVVSLVGAAICGAQTARPILLRDGFAMTGIEGDIKYAESSDTWYFELNSDLSDDRGIIKAGTSLQLLPSVTLERIAADANERSTNYYRLWGIITRYKGSNYIYPNYFQAITITTPQPPQQEDQSEQKPLDDTASSIVQGDANDLLAVPPEIAEKFRAARAKSDAGRQSIADSNTTLVDKPQPTMESGTFISSGPVLVERTAFLAALDDGGFEFVLDAIGRNVPQDTLKLLPCEVLELAEQRQSAVPEPVRFKITGIVTQYKGSDYLLLHKANRFYGHGNFGR